MAVYRIFPSQDSFISTEKTSSNAGLDEILEVAGYPYFGDGKTSRSLVKFSTTEIRDVINNEIRSTNFTSSLKLYLAYASELPSDFSVYSYPIAENWDNGVGKFDDSPASTIGVNWINSRTDVPWTTSSFSSYVTASGEVSGGGSWYTGSLSGSLQFSQSFSVGDNLDLSINVTPAVVEHYNGTLNNYGFVVKLQNSYEYYESSSIILRYFSKDTNTIYPPCLEFKWDDSAYNTGSLSVLQTSNSRIFVNNIRANFIDSGKYRYRISAKPKYPTRTFTTSSIYKTNYALPSSSYWALKDDHTEEMIIDFDTTATKISCDSSGSYFDIYMGGLQPERYYKILIKTVIDGTTTVVDDNNIFKVVRNG